MDIRDLMAVCEGPETEPLGHVHNLCDVFMQSGIYPPYHRLTSPGTEPEAIAAGRPMLMFCSNNYLGLSTHPRVIAGATRQLELHGLGPGGSRCLCGNIDVLNDLEAKAAELVGAEDAITFPTGYMANLAVFKGLLDPFMTPATPYRKGAAAVFCDEGNHATVFDGIAVSHAKKIEFAHNDLDDLSAKLKKYSELQPKLIVTEGVWSLDGELSPLPEIADLASEYSAILMVDDAHGVGMMGSRGGGTVQHYGLEDRVDIIMGSMDKALGGMGGFLAGKKKVIDYLRVAARPYMFSSSMQCTTAGGMIEAMDICMNDPMPRTRLYENARILVDGLRGMGFTVWGDGTVPVAPLIIGDDMDSLAFSERLFELGLYAPPFRWPGVPMGTARIRVTPMATHTAEHLNRALALFEQVGNEMGLLPRAAAI